MTRIIDFAPPMLGIEGEFNTFRLGGAWAKRVQPGDRVGLLDKKEMSLLGAAVVVAVHKGKLNDLAPLHGCRNHNQKHLPSEGAGERVVAAMQKRYGPHKCRENSVVTVIELKEIKHERNDATGKHLPIRET